MNCIFIKIDVVTLLIRKLYNNVYNPIVIFNNCFNYFRIM